MHIHGLPNEPPRRPDELQQRAPSTDRLAADNSRANQAVVRSDSEHSTSTEIVRLAETLSRIPEVREDRVAEAAARYEAGYYLTQEAAEQTADKLLGP